MLLCSGKLKWSELLSKTWLDVDKVLLYYQYAWMIKGQIPVNIFSTGISRKDNQFTHGWSVIYHWYLKSLTCTKLCRIVLFMKLLRKLTSLSLAPTDASNCGDPRLSHSASKAAVIKYNPFINWNFNLSTHETYECIKSWTPKTYCSSVNEVCMLNRK